MAHFGFGGGVWAGPSAPRGIHVSAGPMFTQGMACVVLARARGCAGVSAETSHAIACSGPRSAGQAPFNLWAVPQLALILPAQGQTCRPHHGFPSSAP